MVAALDEARVTERLGEVPGWTLDATRGALYRQLRLKDFASAFALMTRIALAAEQADHHPEWSNVYNRLDIWLTTHDAGGVSERDFALARAINAMLEE
ncbi:4a-hydroxytetrahydrobiopterin dehydratase [Sphingobium sp. DEHP117]|uniref:4a-hydroxytetrahydrobiopterin dehydratase n=1 Tax=Sphingobium sp. DEHP117 TaxID=2993436 RepID=UPI0027D4DE5F|nr:4a-hydroxytetrahydrobiopterin dehydratase [Sphingobium sp. DEHP117]MDQ4419030.1 4a-hydroxytetrahydrobiopterin dehydratase [Sphingobium sp. DEHP117]